ncbi:MAG: flavin-containing monooxygenase [Nostoc sp. DedSLP01]|nr:NAD(P)/FAD-dependent oxidoreductase [Nostoc sp. DedSLP05]MDZ8100893.1 NAD(P)/FAD-dependent oxidoreductase [Nostoc sp. DedSLP01]
MKTNQEPSVNFDVVIVGAGFAGLYMLHLMRKLGLCACVFEAGSGVGGTWFWNRYPGAQCDVESMEYSYQFSDELQLEWVWTQRYASQPEILRYLNHVADRFDLRRDIQLNTRVLSATFDEAVGRWLVETSAGECVSAQFCIMATGCLSSTNTPNFKGREDFAGSSYHTGDWPHEGVDFTGKRVGVIGTGSSAIQCIPLIAQQASHLFVFQRTPAYTIPAHNGPLDPEVQREIKANYANFRAHNKLLPSGTNIPYNEVSALATPLQERQREYEQRWAYGGFSFLGAFADLLFSKEANDTAVEFIHGKIRETVSDPAIAEKLLPRTVFGCKRLCVDTGYYQTFNRSNVTLVDVSTSPIEEIAKHGLTVQGKEYELDAIVFATGYDAMTGSLLKIDIRGKGGRSLKEAWALGPRTYLGVATVGFPNLFAITGPGSPSVLTNMVPSIEQHVEWIADCILYVRDRGFACIEPTLAAQDAWVNHVNEVADATLFPTCNSWYLGANIPGKPRVFMPYLGFPQYVDKCNDVAAKGYEGFVLI